MEEPVWYEWGLLLSTLISAGVFAGAVHEREKGGARSLAALLFGATLWTGSRYLMFQVSGYELVRALDRIAITGGAITVTFFALFIVEFFDFGRYSRRRLAGLLLVEPVLVTVAAWTNPIHGLFWTVDPPSIVVELGVGFWIHFAYSYGVILVASALLLSTILRVGQVFQKQFVLLLVGLYVPVIVNVLHLFGPLELDLTPMAFGVTGLCLFVATNRYGFMDLAPVARNTLVESMDDGMLVVDQDGRIVDTNPAFRSAFDLNASIIGEPYRTALADVPVLRDALEGREEATEVTIESGADDRVYQVAVSTVDGVSREVPRGLAVLHDVTERRKRERELEEREEQLRRQNDRLEQVAGVLAHDLRNPLNVAAARTELATESGDLSHLEVVGEMHERIEEIIDDVLAMARQGLTPEDLETVDLEELATEAWKHVDASGATLRVADTQTIRADATRVSQLFENLFRNACEHCGPDVTITVGVLKEEPGFFVADDGPGIPADDRDSIFEFGYSTSPDGTGFGLSIAREIVEAHGWSIRVTESEDGGAQFEISGVALS